jgi:hypothetical protein
MFIFYLIPPLFGYFVATRLLREREMLTAGLLSISLGLVGILFLVNPLFYFMSLSHALYLSLGIMMAAIILLRFLPAPALHYEPLRRSHLITLAVCCLIIIVFTNYLQMSRLDDDYWVHTPLQGLFLKGQFPPCHPFFPYIELPGHYGRDLTIAALSLLAGEDFIATQCFVTTFIQPLIFLLIFVWVRRLSGNALQGLLAAIFCFFCVNVGARTGLLDIIQNNNSFVYLYLFLIIYLFFASLEDPRTARIVVCSLVLGLYPIVYETHYGLLILGFFAIAAYMARAGEQKSLKPLITCAIIVALTIPLAVTEGGLFTSKLKSHFNRESTENLTANEISNMQKVSMSFPKKEIMQIYLGPGQFQRVSAVFPILFPKLDYEKLSSGYKYAPVWSGSFLILLWFPFYCAPFTLWYLLKKQSQAGLFLWLFGFFSFMVPATVNFGPVFEEEYLRWEGAAGIGFAGALGIVIACALDHLFRQSMKGRRRAALVASLGIFIALNVIGALSYVNQMVINYERFYLGKTNNDVSISHYGFPDPLGLLIARKIGIERIDLTLCKFLREHTLKGDTVLRNFSERDSQDILPEATVSAFAGANMMGHTFPPREEELRFSPFRMGVVARAFWNTGDPSLLKDLSAHWVYVDRNFLDSSVYEKLSGCKELRRVLELEDGQGNRRALFENMSWQGYTRKSSMRLDENAPPAEGIEIADLTLPPLQSSSFYEGAITLRNPSSTLFVTGAPAFLTSVIYDHDTKKPATMFDRIEKAVDITLPAGQASTMGVYFVTPYIEGAYDVKFFLIEGNKARRIRSCDLQIDVRKKPQQPR